jgi:hypothetical protein
MREVRCFIGVLSVIISKFKMYPGEDGKRGERGRRGEERLMCVIGSIPITEMAMEKWREKGKMGEGRFGVHWRLVLLV